MSDYAVAAQFYDAMSGQSDATHVQIAEALARRRLSGQPIIDIGAGTGLTSQAVALAIPDAEVFAVEPDPAMRAALMARIWASPDLRRRVSILPMSILDAPLPVSISAAIASGSLVHFSPGERKRLWAILSDRLEEGGCALIEIQCPLAQDVGATCIAKARIGRVDYEGWGSAVRLDDNRQRWKMVYVARMGNDEIDRQSTDFDCWAVSAKEVIAEALPFGFSGKSDGTLVTLSRL